MFYMFYISGSVIGWIFLYNQASRGPRSHFFVDVWRPLLNGRYSLVDYTLITPRQTGQTEVLSSGELFS